VKYSKELSRTQDGLNKLEKWSKISEMKFNRARYKEPLWILKEILKCTKPKGRIPDQQQYCRKEYQGYSDNKLSQLCDNI